MPETPAPYPWLPPEQALAWAKVDPEGPAAANAELARQAAADWIEDQRRDLLVTDGAGVTTFAATPRVVMAGLIATGRLISRAGNLAGLVNYGEFAASVLRNDPDVRQNLGRNRKVATG